MIHKITILLLSLVMVANTSHAQRRKNKKNKKGTPAASAVNPKSIAAITKNTVKYEGYLTFYLDTTNGKAYIALKETNLNQPTIYFTYSENGLVNLGLNRGIYRETSVIQFEKMYDNINIKKLKTGQYFNPDNPISKSQASNVSDAFVSSEQIIAKDKNTYLISADQVLGSELLHQLQRDIPPGFPFPFKTGRINPSKTHVIKVRSFPENSDIVYSYTFDNGSAYSNDGTVADGRYVTVEVQHSFIQMPDSNFKPRLDDPRIGFFTHQVNDMTGLEILNYKDVIHRWRLEKKDPTAIISEPVKPITWWIENTTPKELIPIIKKAGETWNLAFEPLGFRNAVVVNVQPDTATWDAGDIRYNVLRWTSSPNPPFGGYGPSFVNPLTGEILGADIMLEWIFMTNRIISESIFEPGDAANQHGQFDQNHQFCSFGHHLQSQNAFGKAALNSSKSSSIRDGKIEITPVVEQSLYYLILHEMGHTFGLNHNMKASQLHAPKDLNNIALTSKVGLTGSVMDYPAINFAPKGVKQGQYYTTRPGPYDLWAFEFAYSIGLEEEQAEKARLNAILSKSNQHELTFGNDADDMRSPGKGIDPRVMIGDLSSDAIAYADDRMNLCQSLINDALQNYADSGDSYHELRQKVLMLEREYSVQAGVISRYVGGVYVERGFIGQAGAKTPYTPVSLEDQKRAMKLLTKKVFSAEPITISDSLAARMQPQRRGFGFFAQPEDPKIHGMMLAMQQNVLNHLLSSSVLNRLIDSESYGNEYDITTMMTDLTDAIFKADYNSSVTTFRQNLQIDYVKRLINLAGLGEDKNPYARLMSSSYSNIAKARAYSALMTIKKLETAGKILGNEGSKQHKTYVLALIEEALK